VSARTFRRIWLGAYIALFFGYLFGPLILMSITAFNSASFPRVSPFECFTVEWFGVLANDATLMAGLRHSLLIGFGVVALAVPLGLAGALMLTQVGSRVRPFYYTVVVSPILVPGVVLGISTLIFWDRVGTMFGADYDSIFYDGSFLTVLGQATFISAYTMLVFIARLQRFDPAQEEAALDLGATHVQAFRKILLPFLKPAIGSAAVLAFLASFENYNTTVFTIVSESTLTTVLASKVRYGIDPSISALAVVIVVLTLVGAVIHEIMQRREQAQAREDALEAGGMGGLAPRVRLGTVGNPAIIVMLAGFIAGLGTVWLAGTQGVAECKVLVAEEKRNEAQERIEALRARRAAQAAERAETAAETPAVGTAEIKAKGTEGYTNIFAPTNLQGQVESGDGSDRSPAESATDGGGYSDIFAPSNLQEQTGSGD